jgi:hypothetical protein
VEAGARDMSSRLNGGRLNSEMRHNFSPSCLGVALLRFAEREVKKIPFKAVAVGRSPPKRHLGYECHYAGLAPCARCGLRLMPHILRLHKDAQDRPVVAILFRRWHPGTRMNEWPRRSLQSSRRKLRVKRAGP